MTENKKIRSGCDDLLCFFCEKRFVYQACLDNHVKKVHPRADVLAIQQSVWPAWVFDPVKLQDLCSAVTTFSRSGAVAGFKFLDVPAPLADALVGLARSVSMPDAISVSSMESFSYSVSSVDDGMQANAGIVVIESPSLTDEEVKEILQSGSSVHSDMDDLDDLLRAFEEGNQG